MASLPVETLISGTTVRARFNRISRVTLYRWVERGWLPKPVRIGTLNYWRESDIVALQQRGTAKPQQEAT